MSLYFGEWLKERRKSLDLTQDELAERAGCSVFALRKLESGERRPSKQLAALLAEALQIPAEDRTTFVRVARGELNLERLAPRPGPTSDLPAPGPGPSRSHLPLPPTPLFGRGAELAALERIFAADHCRLLTLTGLGGIGKTRLALEFALRQSGRFPGGVHYVSLTSIASPDLMTPAIADALDFKFSGPTDPNEQLLLELTRRFEQPALLVLDNLEHLLAPTAGSGRGEEVAALLTSLLGRLPALKILATSRERLAIQGEWMYELYGLAVPPAEFADDPLNFSAAAFFVGCAARIRADFSLTPAEYPALVRICRLLDGVPLALELAASWIHLLTCPEIAQEIQTNLDFLTSTMRDLPERHRSIRATFDHSWRLLSPDERSLLCQIAIFQGGFLREAASQIAGASLSLLAALASKSLVRRSESGRYTLHEVIRQYALAHLSEDPQHEAVRDRHADYFLAFLSQREEALKSAGQQATLRELLDEIDNLRRAWTWAIQRQRFAVLGECARTLSWMCETAGLLHEGIGLFEQLIKSLRDMSVSAQWGWVLGVALTQQSLLYFRRGHFEQARWRLEESSALLRAAGNRAWLSDGLVYLGIITHLNGDLAQARRLLEEALECAQSSGNRWFAAYAIFNLGYILSLTGCYERGYEQMQKGFAVWRALGDPHSIALGLNYLSPCLIALGRYAEAESGLRESLTLCEQTKNYWGMGTAYRYLGLTALAQEEVEIAQAHFHSSLDAFSRVTIGWDIARTQIYLGQALLAGGDPVGANQSYLAGLSAAQEARSLPLILDALLRLAELRAESGQTPTAWRLATAVARHEAAVQETQDQANQLLDRLSQRFAAQNGFAPSPEVSADSIDSLVYEELGVGAPPRVSARS